MKSPIPRPVSITPGFSTMPQDRPPVAKSASDSNMLASNLDDGSNLNREVAALSNKLISAINHQIQLDDSLAATQHELELSKARIRHLEALTQEHADMMAKGLLVEKKAVETETQRLMNRLKEESAQRGQAEKDKRHIEQELENLTTALFDEANKMVSAARKERDAVDRKNDQLRAQLADTEELLVSHQEQLVELKEVLQQMTREREETEAAMSACGPSTPSDRHSKDSMGRIFESLHLMPGSSSLEDMPPCPPTALINLVHPVLRHDISSYKDFCEVLYNVKPSESRPVSRMSGGSLASGSFASIGMGLSTPVQSSSASISSSIFGRRRVESGSTTHSPSGSVGSTLETQQHIIALKETKFFKRVMVEDIEPTLRLDTAPGLSWLARRNVMSAITEGSLVVDPMPSSIRVTIFACALCGESKADEQHARTHRMRTSDSPNAQRYPLCWYCTTRLRSACDFMAFLRTLKEGLWKCESEGDQKHAWEESVKLRERMFWARIGGGVIFSIHNQAFRDSSSVYRRDSVESRRSGMHPRQQTETPPRTPVLDGMLNDTKLDIPKKRNSTNPFLTPQRQGQRIESDDDEDDGGSVIRIITDDSISPLEIPLPQSPVGKENRLPIEAQPKVKQPPCPAIPAGW